VLADLKASLKAKRKSMFSELQCVDTPEKLVAFQKDLAAAILEAEQAIVAGGPDMWKDHCHLLRVYGDTLAWTLLDRHAIRQLAKNIDNWPNLLHQRSAVDGVLETAAFYAGRNLPVLASDLTNILTIGDLIVCDNPEAPVIVEVKGAGFSLNSFQADRRTRKQAIRAMRTSEFMATGASGFQRAIGIQTLTSYSWASLGEVLQRARHEGSAVTTVGNQSIIWAFESDGGKLPPLPVSLDDLMQPQGAVHVGCHLSLIENGRQFSTIAPPTVWPFEPDLRYSLLEGDLIVMHLVDTGRFLDRTLTDGWVRRLLPDSRRHAEITGIEIELADGRRATLSPRFITDVVYGFQSIESVVAEMVAFARKALDQTDMLDATSSQPGAKAFGQLSDDYIEILRTQVEAENLKAEQDLSRPVVLPLSVLRSLDPQGERLGAVLWHRLGFQPGEVDGNVNETSEP